MFVALFFAFLIAAVVAVFWYVRQREAELSRDGVLAQGMVVDTTTHSVRLPDGGSTTQQRLVLEWQLPSGQSVRATAGGDPKLHPVGQPVTLRYLPANPQRVRVEK